MQRRYRTPTDESTRSMCDMQLVDFLANIYKTDIARRPTNRLGRCQPSATSPLFFDNLHFEHFDKSVNLDSWLTFLSKCLYEGRSNIRERIFKALFKYVSTRFGQRSFEKCFENTFPNVCSTFQNLRLGTINSPKCPNGLGNVILILMKLCYCSGHILLSIHYTSAVGNSSLFLTNLPFHDFSQLFQPPIVVHNFGKIVKRQVCQKWG